jgi:hypothetical protein
VFYGIQPDPEKTCKSLFFNDLLILPAQHRQTKYTGSQRETATERQPEVLWEF